jgi:uncharacterized cysteine cluster protein YcgN (CxxCxxCC family)
MASKKVIQKKFKQDKCVSDYNVDELDYLANPLGKANFKQPIKKEIKKEAENKSWTDKVKCEVCNKEYARSGVTSHRGTKLHQYKLSMSQKFIGLLDKNVDNLNAGKRKINI